LLREFFGCDFYCLLRLVAPNKISTKYEFLLLKKIILAAQKNIFCCQKSNFAAQKNKNVAAQKNNFAAQSNKFAAHFTNSLFSFDENFSRKS
jgi:hypothetical protein